METIILRKSFTYFLPERRNLKTEKQIQNYKEKEKDRGTIVYEA